QKSSDVFGDQGLTSSDASTPDHRRLTLNLRPLNPGLKGDFHGSRAKQHCCPSKQNHLSLSNAGAVTTRIKKSAPLQHRILSIGSPQRIETRRLRVHRK